MSKHAINTRGARNVPSPYQNHCHRQELGLHQHPPFLNPEIESGVNEVKTQFTSINNINHGQILYQFFLSKCIHKHTS